jgi:hypothetical protein
MSKRWTEKDDIFLHQYFDVVGDSGVARDLGKPTGAATKRVKFLKDCGAWDALNRSASAALHYRKCVGKSAFYDDEVAT